MNYTKLREELTFFEGIRYESYLDSKGLLTAGIGHLIQPSDNINAEKVQVSGRQVEEWFSKDVQAATDRCKKILGVETFNGLDEVRQRIVVQLVFNLGDRFAKFTDTIAAIKAKDWNKAADELQDSKWYKQVGRRGPITVSAMRNGFYNI